MIKNFNLDNLKDLYYSHIAVDFPPEERPSFRRLNAMINDGLIEVLSFADDNNKDLAYAICAANESYVLLLFFAVFKEYRSQGVGTKFLKELKNYYSNKNGIILEVEKPELAKNNIQKEIATKRISFYSKSNFILLDNIDYVIWDVPMYLMVMPTYDNSINFNTISNAVKEIYRPMLGKHFDSKLIIKETNH